MSAGEDYLDQRIRRVELRELELEARERRLEDAAVAERLHALELLERRILEQADMIRLASRWIIILEQRELELECLLADALEQRDAARTLAARLEAETASCPTWIFHVLDVLAEVPDEPTGVTVVDKGWTGPPVDVEQYHGHIGMVTLCNCDDVPGRADT